MYSFSCIIFLSVYISFLGLLHIVEGQRGLNDNDYSNSQYGSLFPYVDPDGVSAEDIILHAKQDRYTDPNDQSRSSHQTRDSSYQSYQQGRRGSKQRPVTLQQSPHRPLFPQWSGPKPSHLQNSQNGPVTFPESPPLGESFKADAEPLVVSKPSPHQWIFGRNKEDKLNLISWLIDGCYFYTKKDEVQQFLPTSTYEKCKHADNPTENPDNESHPPEFQTYDGFFNNPFKVDLGAVGKVPPVYKDGTYEPVEGERINPFKASKLMERKPGCTQHDPLSSSGPEGCGSKTGKTAFLVYFGQQVVEELLDAQRPGCPPEYFNVPIPPDHEFSSEKNESGKSEMPFLRSRWSQNSGHSPGNPRQQLNEITPWIDGGLIYGTAKGWADVLRTNPDGTLVPHGLLASVDNKGYFPAINKLRLPLANPPPPAHHSVWTKQHETANVNRFFVLGNPRGNENAFLLSFGVVLFRWHNLIATYLHDSRPKWSGERIFQEARKWVIGTYQNIVMYDWIPEWLGDSLGEYEKYDPSIDPQIEQFFQTAAMRFGHTLVTPGGYIRDYACAQCKLVAFAGLGGHKGMHTAQETSRNSAASYGAVRTCNIFWRPQEPLLMKYEDHPCVGESDRDFADIDRMLMGLASHKSEREDNMIVEDLRGRVFGPLEFSRRDLMAVNIQRGRDHGTPDYNTAREAFGLNRITSVDEFFKETKSATPREIVEELERIHRKSHNSSTKFLWDNIDVWTGGILETTYRPGRLFRAIIKDQFARIRNADRFWFENKNWKKERFTATQIDRIKTLKVFDIIVSVTKMLPEDIQANPFRVPTEVFKQQSPQCFSAQNSSWETGRCYTFDNETELPTSLQPNTCYHFPQLDSSLVPVEQCTGLSSYDYFDGSEISFITTFTVIGIIILVIASLVPVFASFRQKEKDAAMRRKTKLKSFISESGSYDSPISAREYLGSKEGSRAVVLIFTPNKVLEVRSHKDELLRSVDFSRADELDVILVNDGKHVVIKNPKEYDCVFSFEGKILRTSFVTQLKKLFQEGSTKINENTGSLHQSLASALTKDKRLRKLDKFFKLVFAQAFSIDQPKGEAELVDPKLIREVIRTELTKAEFANALGMESGSQFVEKMFGLIDRDGNGYISFKEFLEMLVTFAKGTADEKSRLMFEMYDINRSGTLSPDEFKGMIRSMVEAANADVDEEELEKMTKLMLKGLGRDSEISLHTFQRLMSQYQDTLGYAQLNFSGVNVPESQPMAKSGRKSFNDKARATILSIYGMDSIMEEGIKGIDQVPKEIERTSVTITPGEAAQGPLSRWIELYRLQIFWGIMYTLIFIVIFVERAYVYSVEKEHGGLRRIAGYGVTVTRGAASAIMFTFASLLLTMCRNIITRLRETFLHRFIPFDSFIGLHKFIAILGLGSCLIHIVGHAINFYHISTQTASDLSCLFRDYHRPTHILPKFHYWAFQTVTGLSGIALVILGALIYSFATNYARAFAFRMFWITHNSYPLFYILMLIHGSGRLVQEPLFFNFLCGPLIIFVLDKLISAGRKQVEIPVLRAEILPSNVTKLEFAKPAGFEYKSGQWVRIATAALSAREFHPFTLSSAPHEPHLSCHIRAVGPFTANIRQIYERSLPKLFLDGPYGEGHQDWWRYDVSILVGGGIGVTPFASILKDVAYSSNPRNCKKIYFLWVTRTQKQFEWLVDIIREVEANKLISVHLFITQIYNKFDLRTVLLYVFERHFQRINNRSLFTGLKSTTHFGRPNFVQFFKTLRSIHPNVSKFGVFSCGPFPLTKTVDEACEEVSSLTDGAESIFQHHFENF
ncbi:Dual oxidase 2 [Folsomia candida]|uniref:NAD(P)H oxidase (H2O2-forming) n=1 Tax=Folsomia candida TaxID=158441 RepID=A0A226EJB9_FOLCA|nr:Dual oxidase 2 [Folsomia candida]